MAVVQRFAGTSVGTLQVAAAWVGFVLVVVGEEVVAGVEMAVVASAIIQNMTLIDKKKKISNEK